MTAATELPQMSASAHSHATYNAHNIATSAVNAVGQINQLTLVPEHAQWHEAFDADATMAARIADLAVAQRAQYRLPKPQGAQAVATPTLRRVQVFIADTDTNVPLADRILYEGQPITTDLTDQELFYDLPIRDILETHNAKRVKLYDKAVKTRSQMLEPLRIRDLKMTVVTIASF